MDAMSVNCIRAECLLLRFQRDPLDYVCQASLQSAGKVALWLECGHRMPAKDCTCGYDPLQIPYAILAAEPTTW